MNTNNKNKSIIPYIVAAVCAIAYISLMNNENVWLDEAFTATLVHTDLAGVLSRSASDTLPPMYNIILWAMTSLFGYKVAVMKLTSVIPMLFVLVLGVTVVRRRFGDIISSLFAICVTGMPLMLFFGMEIRMYSMGFWFATASGIFAYEYLRDSGVKNFALFVLSSVLAGYTHHFAFVTVGFVFLFLLIYYIIADRAHIKRWFTAVGATLILYIPCLIVTIRQIKSVNGYFSMPEVTLKVFLKYIVYPYVVGFTPATLLLMALVAALLLMLLLRAVRDRKLSGEEYYALACFFTFYGVLVFGSVVSKIMTANIFVDRYLFFATGLLWLGVAILAENAAKDLKEHGIFAYIAIFAVTIFAFIFSYRNQFRLEYGNSALEEKAYLSEEVSEGDVLYTIEDNYELAYCLPFYVILTHDNEDLTHYGNISTALDVCEEADSVMWIAVSGGKSIPQEVIVQLDERGFDITKEMDMDFDRYKCELYKAEK